MQTTIRAICIPAILVLAAAGAIANATPADGQESVVIVYADGRRQNLDVSDIARIELKPTLRVVFKDERKKSPSTANATRIEFEGAASSPVSGRSHFVGKWEVGEGNGGSDFFITLEENGEARKSIGASHGTWTVASGEARISWDDGWHDAIRKVGPKHEKLAFEPGKSFEDKPSNVTPARNTQPKPI
jgi:hypothetical protein